MDSSRERFQAHTRMCESLDPDWFYFLCFLMAMGTLILRPLTSAIVACYMLLSQSSLGSGFLWVPNSTSRFFILRVWHTKCKCFSCWLILRHVWTWNTSQILGETGKLFHVLVTWCRCDFLPFLSARKKQITLNYRIDLHKSTNLSLGGKIILHNLPLSSELASTCACSHLAHCARETNHDRSVSPYP